MEPIAYSIDEAIALGPWGRTTVYGLIAQGKLRARKNGRRTLILRADLLACVADMPEVGSGARSDCPARRPKKSCEAR